MHILITGISGQIGTRMAGMLAGRGVRFSGLDIAPPRVDCPFFRYDLTSPAEGPELAEFLAPVTHVVHLASVMSVADDVSAQFDEHFRVNVVGLTHLLRALPPGIEHFAFASSMTVYGVPERMPVDEGHPTRPNNLYALGKLAAERYLRLHARAAGLPTALLRYSSVYGPGAITHRAVPNMIETVLDGGVPHINGTGATVRDYVYIDDVVEATLAAGRLCADGVFNVGSGRATSVAEVARTVLDELAPEREPVYDASRPDGYDMHYSVQRMVRELGCPPRVGFAEGIRLTAAWHAGLRG